MLSGQHDEDRIEFWDQTPEHREDIGHFIHDRQQTYFAGTTQYDIGRHQGIPYALICADPIKADDLTFEESSDWVFPY